MTYSQRPVALLHCIVQWFLQVFIAVVCREYHLYVLAIGHPILSI